MLNNLQIKEIRNHVFMCSTPKHLLASWYNVSIEYIEEITK